MKHLKSYKLFEASYSLLMKMDIIDIFQNVIDAGFTVVVNLGLEPSIHDKKAIHVINIKIDTPINLSDYLILSKDDNSPERIKSSDPFSSHHESTDGLNIRDNILQLKSYGEGKGYKINKLTSGTYIVKDIDLSKEDWFVSLNITLSKSTLNESIIPDNDLESDIVDICQDLIDDGYFVDFGKKVDSNNVYKSDTLTIYKSSNANGGTVTRVKYTDIKETLDRIERYLGDKYSKTLILPADYSKYVDITGMLLDRISGAIFKAIIEYKI